MRFFILSLCLTASSAFAGIYGDKLATLMDASQATLQPSNGVWVLEGRADGSSARCLALLEQEGNRTILQLQVSASRGSGGRLAYGRTVDFTLFETPGLSDGEADPRIREVQDSSSRLRLKSVYDHVGEQSFPGGFSSIVVVTNTIEVKFNSRSKAISKIKITSRSNVHEEAAACRFDN